MSEDEEEFVDYEHMIFPSPEVLAAIERREREAEAARPAIDRDPNARELLQIARKGGLLGNNKSRTRTVGRRVNMQGGFAYMQHVAMLLRAGYPNGEGGADGWHPGELECAWDKIGLWRW